MAAGRENLVAERPEKLENRRHWPEKQFHLQIRSGKIQNPTQKTPCFLVCEKCGLTEKLEQTVRHKMSRSKTTKKLKNRKISESPSDQQLETAYRTEEEDSAGFISQDSRQNIMGWVIPLAIILTLFLIGAFFSSLQVPAPVTKPKVLKAVSQKPEPEKELQTVKRLDSNTQDITTGKPITEKKEKKEMFYMGIKISR